MGVQITANGVGVLRDNDTLLQNNISDSVQHRKDTIRRISITHQLQKLPRIIIALSID